MSKFKSPKEEFESIYKHLFEAYGVGLGGWDSIHCQYNSYMFCDANQVSIIGEYLNWYWFVKYAKKYNITYYCGIDTFLRVYKPAVKSKVQLNDDAWSFDV